MASSSRYGDSKFNLAAQGHRQPGSTFKVMVLMTALRRGVDPQRTTYTSKPLKVGDPQWGPIDDQDVRRTTTAARSNLVRATLRSDNTVFAQLAPTSGPHEVKQTAKDMGIKTQARRLPGRGARRPTHRRHAARDGQRVRDDRLRRLAQPADRDHAGDVPRRRVELPRRQGKHKAFEDGVTAEATQILEQNIQSGTGTNATIGCPAAGKTGTTDKFNDAWFVGFTPRLATAVWLGHPNARRSRCPVPGARWPAARSRRRSGAST